MKENASFSWRNLDIGGFHFSAVFWRLLHLFLASLRLHTKKAVTPHLPYRNVYLILSRLGRLGHLENWMVFIESLLPYTVLFSKNYFHFAVEFQDREVKVYQQHWRMAIHGLWYVSPCFPGWAWRRRLSSAPNVVTCIPSRRSAPASSQQRIFFFTIFSIFPFLSGDEISFTALPLDLLLQSYFWEEPSRT